MITLECYTRIVQIVRDRPDLCAMNGGAQDSSDLTAGYFVFPKFERQIQSDQLQAGALLCPAKSTSANVNAGKIFCPPIASREIPFVSLMKSIAWVEMPF